MNVDNTGGSASTPDVTDAVTKVTSHIAAGNRLLTHRQLVAPLDKVWLRDLQMMDELWECFSVLLSDVEFHGCPFCYLTSPSLDTQPCRMEALTHFRLLAARKAWILPTPRSHASGVCLTVSLFVEPLRLTCLVFCFQLRVLHSLVGGGVQGGPSRSKNQHADKNPRER